MLPTKFWFNRISSFREEDFQTLTNQKKNCLGGHVLTNRDEMSNIYREPSIDALYQMPVHLGKHFQRIFFRNQPIRNKNGLWRPCLLTNRNYMSSLYRGPSNDASYQVSVHLVKGFQSRRLKKISQSETIIACTGMFVDGSGQNQQTLQGTFHRCFLPSFSSFG